MKVNLPLHPEEKFCPSSSLRALRQYSRVPGLGPAALAPSVGLTLAASPRTEVCPFCLPLSSIRTKAYDDTPML